MWGAYTGVSAGAVGAYTGVSAGAVGSLYWGECWCCGEPILG